MKQHRTPSVGIFTIGIAALFLLGFLLLVIFGASAYKNSADSQNLNNSRRGLLSYLSSVTRAYDGADSVELVDSDYGRMIVITLPDGFGIRIFHADGKLLEDDSLLSMPPDPETAQLIGETERFDIEEIQPGFFRVVTDQGESLLSLRSGGGDSR